MNTTIKAQLPGCVNQVLLRADGEFLSRQSVQAAMTAGFQYIIANKGCTPPFDTNGWYRPWKRKNIQYNSCTYTPIGWGLACGALRAGLLLCEFQKNKRSLQGNRFNASFLKMTVIPIGFFYTSLAGKAHKVIAKYDKRAYVENLVDEVKREGLDAVPSGRFKNNYAFFKLSCWPITSGVI